MKVYRFIILPILAFLFIGCAESNNPAMPAEAMADSSDAQEADSSPAALASLLLEAEHSASATPALVDQMPELDRPTAYAIQLEALDQEIANGERLIGWKMGGSRVVDPAAGPDPSFAYMLASDSLVDGQVIDAASFVDGVVQVEAEIAFVMGQDLPGPTVTMDQLKEAIDGVVGAIELISVRVAPSSDGTAPTIDHMIAGQLSHAGVMLTETRVPVDAIDAAAEVGSVEIDGEAKASGAGAQIMGTNPLDALLWIANALLEQGHFLRAGDVVITGGLYDNPILFAGSTATVSFTTLGSLSVSMAE
jgi:2-keto-4-pentenoate hydratase